MPGQVTGRDGASGGGAPVVPVLVVGSGPTGLAAATLLAQYGVPSLVVDRWAGVLPQPRAVHLDAEVCRILTRLGVLPRFRALSRPARGLRLLDRRRRVLAEVERPLLDAAHGHPAANLFDQPELDALLLDNLRRCPQATVRTDVDVLDLEQDGDLVRVQVEDRRSGAREVLLAEHVLGCDGARSTVRRCIGARMRDLGPEQRWLVVDVATGAPLDLWNGVHQICDPDRAATYLRVGPTRHRWEFRLHEHETAADLSSLAALRPLLQPWVRDPPHDLELLRVSAYTFRAQVADRWRDRRVFLLGDAAHLTPPFVGQGLGAGLRDASNLAWKLAAVRQGALPDEALDSYEAERRPHAAALVRRAVLVGRVMTASGALGAVLRSVVVPVLLRAPGVRTRVAGSSSPALSSSSLVRRSSRPGSLPGTLCPNVVLGAGERLDDRVGGAFAVVSRVPLPEPERREIAARGAVLVEAAPGSPLHGWLRSGRARWAVVRPDRTVLRAGSDPRGLADAVPALVAPPGRADDDAAASPAASSAPVVESALNERGRHPSRAPRRAPGAIVTPRPRPFTWRLTGPPEELASGPPHAPGGPLDNGTTTDGVGPKGRRAAGPPVTP